MNRSREALVAELSAHARTIERPGRTARAAWLWLATAALCAWLGVHWTGEFRFGAVALIGSAPRYALEFVLGAAAIAALAWTAFRTAIPDPRPIERRVLLPLVLLAAWLLVNAYGLVDPAIEPTMDGKREHCWLQTLYVALPSLALGLYALRRWWPLHGAWSGALLGCAAGAIPALLMQIACMYVPEHTLLYHLLPGLAVGAAGAGLGILIQR